jgi:predicted peptidase
LPEIIDELARLYPVDRGRVYLIGHSMGAAHAAAMAGENAELYAGVAALGGGGRIRTLKELRALPFFIGIGAEDFALTGAKTLRKTLEQAGLKTLEYREYQGIEHLCVVQEALPDVFQFFDRAKRE